MQLGELAEKLELWAKKSEQKTRQLPKAAELVIPDIRYKGESLRQMIGVKSIQNIYDSENRKRLPPQR